ncbi:MAG: hypothetical protein H0U59_08080 [Gemmatimonadaceae bacterium]|nr:hypothetical protein [Gemmatimonadaceae bacterium]
MHLPPESSEQRSEMLDPHRREKRADAATEITGRLLQKGVEVDAAEDPAVLADLFTAVERFESAVIEAGGDPMVNMPTSTDPESPDFVLPPRSADESLDSYAARIDEAAETLERRIG